MSKGGLGNFKAQTVMSKDGTEIFAEAVGNPAKPHVVFVHGVACTGAIFDPIFILAEMQAHIYAVRYDARGHGRSGKPETADAYISGCYADDFEAVCRAFNLRKPVFCGWSLSGTISADLLSAAKIPLSGLIYLSALPCMGEIMGLVPTPLGLSYIPRLCAEDAAEALKTRIEFCRLLVAPERLANVPVQDMHAWIGGACYLLPRPCQLLLGRQQDTAPLFAAGKTGLPLLILHGKEDLLISGAAVIENMAPKFTDCETVLLDCGHMPFYEQPELTARHILQFVGRVSKTSIN